MEICAFYFFWFGDIDKLTAGVPNPNYLKQKQKQTQKCEPVYTEEEENAALQEFLRI